MTNMAFEYIKDKILEFKIGQGEVVSDYAISQDLGISRTPVREAIKQLEHYGLVERENGRMVVSALTIKDIEEIFDVREALATKCYEIIIKNKLMTKKAFDKLSKIIDEHEEVIANHDWKKNFELDDLFHREVMRLAGNKRMNTFSEVMSLQIQRARWLTTIRPDAFKDTISQHRHILEGLAEGDLEKALKMQGEHFDFARNNYYTILKSDQLKMMFGGFNSIIKK